MLTDREKKAKEILEDLIISLMNHSKGLDEIEDRRTQGRIGAINLALSLFSEVERLRRENNELLKQLISVDKELGKEQKLSELTLKELNRERVDCGTKDTQISDLQRQLQVNDMKRSSHRHSRVSKEEEFMTENELAIEYYKKHQEKYGYDNIHEATALHALTELPKVQKENERLKEGMYAWQEEAKKLKAIINQDYTSGRMLELENEVVKLREALKNVVIYSRDERPRAIAKSALDRKEE